MISARDCCGAGMAWRVMYRPPYGPPTTIYNRYNRWAGHGIWQRLFEKVAVSGPGA
jgi:transposase